MTSLDDLLSKESQTRDNAVDRILHDRKVVIDQLISVVDPANAAKYGDESRCAAAYLLSEFRAVEAVDVLSKALSNPPGRKISSDLSRYDHPITGALVNIGRPAVPAMLANVENSDNPTLRSNSMHVLLHVLGGGKTRLLEVLRKVHDRAVKNERSPIVLRRLTEARSWVEQHYQWPPGSEEPLY